MSGFTTLISKGPGGSSTPGNGLGNANLGPFGSLETSQLTPSGQATFVYGINSTQWTTGSLGTSAGVSWSTGVVTCSSGISSDGWSSVSLLRGLKYRAGQGSICRLTAVFDPGVDNSLQIAGIGNRECGYYFAMSGSQFGILHRERSNVEIRSFTITSAPVGSTSVTITLNGSAKVVSINPNGSTSQAAYQLSIQGYSSVDGGWDSEAVGNTVYFIARMPGVRSGSYSLSGVGFVSTSSQIQVGSTPTQTFIPQTSWNIDKLDGGGSYDFNVNPQKGNIYQIGLQYLGFGDVTFSIENSETGAFTQCHKIKFANNTLTTNVKNPQMSARWESSNQGAVIASTSIKGASAGNFTEGHVMRNVGPAFSAIAVSNSVSTSIIPILSIRTNRVFGGQFCCGEASVFNISIGTDTGNSSSNRLVTIYVYKGVNLTGPTNFVSGDQRSLVSYDSSSTGLTVNGAMLLKSFLVAANDSVTLSLADENFFLSSGEQITIAARATAAIDNVTASISWFEDQ